MRTGVQWRDPPERYGRWKTVHARHQHWSTDGRRETLLQRIRAEADATAGGTGRPAGGGRAGGEALGRSRGGFTTDCTQFEPVMDRNREPRLTAGGPHTGPDSPSVPSLALTDARPVHGVAVHGQRALEGRCLRSPSPHRPRPAARSRWCPRGLPARRGSSSRW
ncbi:transposase [Streptomyces sp. NPDC059680]|uniref:transposase n=1 Tax=Streptomyces sp. NPDC059680 TaxID=3346904 RepID=UPI0036A353CA